MSTRRPADVPDDGSPAVEADIDSLDPASQAVEDEAKRLADNELAFKLFSAETARLEAYGPLLDTLFAARGFPVLGGNDQTLAASNQANLDPGLKRAAKATALAVLGDVRRIADRHCGFDDEDQGEQD